MSWWTSFYFGLPFTLKAEVYKHSLVTRPSAVGGVANRMLNRLLHIIRQAVSSWILMSCESHRVTSGWITHSELSCNISKHVTKSQVCQIHCYNVIQNTFLPLESITKSQVCQIHCYNVIQNSFAPLQDMLLNHKFVKFSVENQPSLYLGMKRTCLVAVCILKALTTGTCLKLNCLWLWAGSGGEIFILWAHMYMM